MFPLDLVFLEGRRVASGLNNFELLVDCGHFCFIGTWRVGGVLAMSRAFGNRLLKQFVVAEPEIQVFP